MKNQLLIIVSIVFLIGLVSFVSAESKIVYKQGDIDIKIPCFNNNTYCSPSAECNITIHYPNGTNLINNAQMTHSGAYFNYSLNKSQITELGDYYASVVCQDNNISGHSTFTFLVSRTGETQSTSKSIIYGIILLIIFSLSMFSFIIGFSSEKMPLLIIGILAGFIFLIFLWQLIILNPENVTSLVGETGYQLLLWIFWTAVILIIILILFSALQWHNLNKKSKMAKWGILDEDEF